MTDRISDTRWREADRILDDALDQEAGLRLEHIAAACGDDDELRALVERLLERCDVGDTRITAGGALRGAFADSLDRELAGDAADPAGTPNRIEVMR